MHIRKLDCEGKERVDGCGGEKAAEENGLTLGSSFLETGKRMSLGRDFPTAHEFLYRVVNTSEMPCW